MQLQQSKMRKGESEFEWWGGGREEGRLRRRFRERQEEERIGAWEKNGWGRRRKRMMLGVQKGERWIGVEDLPGGGNFGKM